MHTHTYPLENTHTHTHTHNKYIFKKIFANCKVYFKKYAIYGEVLDFPLLPGFNEDTVNTKQFNTGIYPD